MPTKLVVREYNFISFIYSNSSMVLADLTEIVKNNYNTKSKSAAFYQPTLSCAKQNTGGVA